MQPVGGRVSSRRVGGDDENLVAGAPEMLDDPQHRVGDTVDVRQERLGDDRNAHTGMVAAVDGAEVALTRMACE